jgi:hypothetical protein
MPQRKKSQTEEDAAPGAVSPKPKRRASKQKQKQKREEPPVSRMPSETLNPSRT